MKALKRCWGQSQKWRVLQFILIVTLLSELKAIISAYGAMNNCNSKIVSNYN